MLFIKIAQTENEVRPHISPELHLKPALEVTWPTFVMTATESAQNLKQWRKEANKALQKNLQFLLEMTGIFK